MAEAFDWVRARIDTVSDSLFLVPAAFILALAAGSQFARNLDGRWQAGDNPWLLATTIDSARAILTTVATATVTVAAIVFSMTSVVVQLATNQFSPRVTQDFLRDRYQQVTIGITIGTFVYSLLVLGSVREAQGDVEHDFHFSVTVGVVLAVLSMLAIVSFIDRVMRSMRVDTIVSGLAHESERAFEKMPDPTPTVEGSLDPDEMSTSSRVRMTQSGWIRYLDLDEILSALPGNTLVRLDMRTGDFVPPAAEVGSVWPAVDDRTAHAVVRAITVGKTRTIHADPAYGIRQMVDIALRALSPSLNDPTTGADIVRQLTGPMRALLLNDLPGRVVGDDRGNRVYVPRALSYDDYVHGAFTDIRLNAGAQPYVLLALVETLGALLATVEDAGIAGRSRALEEEARATIEAIRSSDMGEHDKQKLYASAQAAAIPEF